MRPGRGATLELAGRRRDEVGQQVASRLVAGRERPADRGGDGGSCRRTEQDEEAPWHARIVPGRPAVLGQTHLRDL